ncbi:hypothetical protein PanWU01x14_368220, partial [Parasponia andersonii]
TSTDRICKCSSFCVIQVLDVKLNGVEAFRQAVESISGVKLLSKSLLRTSTVKSTFNTFSTTTTSFSLSARSLIMSLLGFGHPFIVDKIESHETESLIVDLNVDGPWFTFSLIEWWNVEVLEDASKEETIRKKESLILYGIHHLMNNEIK